MELEIKNLQKKIKLSPSRIKKAIRTALRHDHIIDACLSVVFVTDTRIKTLNRKFLGRNYATDVLSFDLSSRGSSIRSITGEIVISTDMVYRNARRFNVPVEKELDLYLIHGVLHLMGYNDQSENESLKMRIKEQAILKKLGHDR